MCGGVRNAAGETIPQLAIKQKLQEEQQQQQQQAQFESQLAVQRQQIEQQKRINEAPPPPPPSPTTQAAAPAIEAASAMISPARGMNRRKLQTGIAGGTGGLTIPGA